jgi:hypothetical protein
MEKALLEILNILSTLGMVLAMRYLLGIAKIEEDIRFVKQCYHKVADMHLDFYRFPEVLHQWTGKRILNEYTASNGRPDDSIGGNDGNHPA